MNYDDDDDDDVNNRFSNIFLLLHLYALIILQFTNGMKFHVKYINCVYLFDGVEYCANSDRINTDTHDINSIVWLGHCLKCMPSSFFVQSLAHSFTLPFNCFALECV